ncbi:hypothetical protein SAMN05216315_13255 [Nitrosospira sp. Nsp18]|uniref:hypothetical protein n=1 Tax=Nitrosospira sp. Nsp18 TaxID=1855334 RepID=UPI00088A5176|nr:hypothetical protein [Nitrosospira sp. Nsp18]SDA27270.1 hypothetical protein SAMN05216315_13255 [Nitrosospira sp. Nsp18]
MDNQSGFIDLVLQDKYATTFLVIECKRMRDATWLFMQSGEGLEKQHTAKGWVSRFSPDKATYFGFHDVREDPATPEAIFCAVRGQSTNDKRTLFERIGGELVSATEALAQEERDFRPTVHDTIRFYFNVIVTTAELKMAYFSPGSISLSDGTLTDARIEDVPFLRFRKQLSIRSRALTLEDYSNDRSGSSAAMAKEKTIFVVRADALLEFLRQFQVPDYAVRHFDY